MVVNAAVTEVEFLSKLFLPVLQLPHLVGPCCSGGSGTVFVKNTINYGYANFLTFYPSHIHSFHKKEKNRVDIFSLMYNNS
jgi:hypothetical protein